MCFAQENNESLSWDSNRWLTDYESDDLPTLVPIELEVVITRATKCVNLLILSLSLSYLFNHWFCVCRMTSGQ